MATNVRLSEASAAMLERLAAQLGAPRVKIIEMALKKLDEEQFWNAVDEGYARHGASLAAEAAVFDGAMGDGLDGIPA